MANLQNERTFQSHWMCSLEPPLLELDIDDTFVKPFYWSSISQAYTRVLHVQDFPKRVVMDVL